MTTLLLEVFPLLGLVVRASYFLSFNLLRGLVKCAIANRKPIKPSHMCAHRPSRARNYCVSVCESGNFSLGLLPSPAQRPSSGCGHLHPRGHCGSLGAGFPIPHATP